MPIRLFPEPETKTMITQAPKALAVCGAALLLIAGACTHPIARQLRKAAQADAAQFPAVLADPEPPRGTVVVWGGRIIEITNLKDRTEMIVVEKPLDFLGTPDPAQPSRGRFIAHVPAFLDPAVYLADRDITLAGELTGTEKRDVGEAVYMYPVVSVRQFHLWETLAPPHPAQDWTEPAHKPR